MFFSDLLLDERKHFLVLHGLSIIPLDISLDRGFGLLLVGVFEGLFVLLWHPISTFQYHSLLDCRRKSRHGNFPECATFDLSMLIIVFWNAPSPTTFLLFSLFFLKYFLFVVFLIFELGLVVGHRILSQHQFRLWLLFYHAFKLIKWAESSFKSGTSCINLNRIVSRMEMVAWFFEWTMRWTPSFTFSSRWWTFWIKHRSCLIFFIDVVASDGLHIHLFSLSQNRK